MDILQMGLVLVIIWLVIYLIVNVGSLLSGTGLIIVKEFNSINREINRERALRPRVEERRITPTKILDPPEPFYPITTHIEVSALPTHLHFSPKFDTMDDIRQKDGVKKTFGLMPPKNLF